MLCRSVKSSHALRTSLKCKWNAGASNRLYSSDETHTKSRSGQDDIPEQTTVKSSPTENKARDAKDKLSALLLSLRTESVADSSSYSDLAQKLNLAKPKLRNRKLTADQGVKHTSKYVSSEVLDAVDSVADSLGGDSRTTQSELVQKLESHAKTTEQIKNAKLALSDLVTGMKVDTARKGEQSQENRQKPKEARKFDRRGERRENIFSSSKPLGIFTPFSQTGESTISFTPTFDELSKRELKLMVTHPPRNGFEEMIQWTEQGKTWIFPINNEQGLEEEAKVGFHEHIFMEQYLQGWCPRRGPIRHFMELVCTGLSKNPYITVEQKKEHIFWFRDYFDGKKEILAEIGALDDKISVQA
nr:EOG090X04UC [Lepidurus arcticus]